MPNLTSAQARVLAEVRAAGERSYNGRARRSVEALAGLGLVTYDYDLVLHAKGGGVTATERFTVRPSDDILRRLDEGSTQARRALALAHPDVFDAWMRDLEDGKRTIS